MEPLAKIVGYDRKRNTDDLEEAIMLLMQENIAGAKKKIDQIKQRLEQIEKLSSI